VWRNSYTASHVCERPSHTPASTWIHVHSCPQRLRHPSTNEYLLVCAFRATVCTPSRLMYAHPARTSTRTRVHIQGHESEGGARFCTDIAVDPCADEGRNSCTQKPILYRGQMPIQDWHPCVQTHSLHTSGALPSCLGYLMLPVQGPVLPQLDSRR
jgi:hypothetical protein